MLMPAESETTVASTWTADPDKRQLHGQILPMPIATKGGSIGSTSAVTTA